MARKGPRPTPLRYHDTKGLLEAGYVTRTGLWIEANVWRGYSPTATWITDTLDSLSDRVRRPRFECLAGWIVRTLGTANYFS